MSPSPAFFLSDEVFCDDVDAATTIILYFRRLHPLAGRPALFAENVAEDVDWTQVCLHDSQKIFARRVSCQPTFQPK